MIKIKKEGKIIVSNNPEKSKTLQEVKKLLIDNIDFLGPRWSTHLPLFLGSSEIARILWLNHVYQLTINIPGCIIEFGSQFGASFNLLNMFRLIYEPWNVSRRVISLSTFEEGFVDVDEKDGSMVELGDYAVEANWKKTINKILNLNTKQSPIGDVHDIIEGDVSKTLPILLDDHPEMLISLAHFDLDVYKPTKFALEKILNRIPKGGILVFDELNHPGFPGETIAINEVLGVHNLKLIKSQFQPYSCYVIVE